MLFQHEEQLGYKYTTDFTTGFHYVELPSGAYEKNRILEQNAIVFIIEGSCSFSFDQYKNNLFFAGDMLFFPKSAIVSGVVLEGMKMLYMTFDTPLGISDRLYIQQQWNVIRDITYTFTPLKMNYPIGILINSLVYLMKNGGENHAELHEIKHREVFVMLRMFYTKEEFAMFFYPIIGKNFNFKNFVLENYINCYNLKELIERSDMCANVFMRKFKTEFGMSGYQWILKQMCQRIQHKASEPGVTIKDIMCEVGIQSPTHFNRICKRYFNQTPKQLIDFCQNDLHKHQAPM